MLTFNSIRSRMVIGFLVLTFLIIVLAIFSFSIFSRIKRVAATHAQINQLEVLTLNLIKSDNDFFDQETTNENYFKTHQSDFLLYHDSVHYLISKQTHNGKRVESTEIAKHFEIIDSLLIQYNTRFTALEKLVFKKGFKDFGVEGAMRYHAHAMEDAADSKEMLAILSLRRHEKDFLLRSDTSYITAFRKRSAELNKEWSTKNEDTSALDHLKVYQQWFFTLVSIHQELGLTSKDGLRNELNVLSNQLSRQYHQLTLVSSQEAQTVYDRLKLVYITGLISAVIFSFFSAYWISKRLSAPIARLSTLIREAIDSRTLTKTNLVIPNAAREIEGLANSFTVLIAQIHKQLNRIRKKSRLLKVKNKELKKVSREMDNFLYSTAHDLRSPLSSLLGLITLVRHENKQDNLNIYIDMMEKSIHRSESFISQIVSFFKNKRMDLHQEQLDLRAIITHALEDHQFIEGADKIKYDISIVGGEPFYSDKIRLTIIFNNLISNAIKYADYSKPESFLNIIIEINSREARIHVLDNGLGISSEHIDNIFNMFYRAHDTSKGSGLGLFIFKETITRLQGDVAVTSEAGAGTRFVITIPNLLAAYQPYDVRLN